MSLWGKTDTAADAPKYLSDADADNAYFVDITEAGVAANKAKGLGTGGWNLYSTYTDSDGATRHRAENLVAMGVTAVNAGDVGAIVINATSMVIGTVYSVATTGTTNYTLVGAANSDVGTSFTATAKGAGNGTVAVTDDIIAANAAVTDTEYYIVSTGTTDFTAIGAANSDVGTTFTANTAGGAATGTGTLVATADIVTASAIADTTATDYTILTAGTSDFTLIGAANNDVGTEFTSEVIGLGTGTVAVADDPVVADS